MANCLHCNKEYSSIRATSRYCSDKCRLYHYRSLKGVTLSPKPVTLRDKSDVTLTNDVTLSKVKPNRVKPLMSRPFEMCPKHNVYRSSCGCR